MVLLTCMLLPATARAGGPTSALLVAPATGQTAALYNSDPEYEQLMMLLDEPATSTNPDDADPAPSAAADYVTVTWLIHDVTVWRIDRIFLPAGSADEPWIVTQTDSGDPAAVPLGSGMFPGQQGNDSALRHRSTDPAALMGLLTGLGLLGVGESAAVGDSSAAAMAAAAAVDPPTRPTGVWWAVGGALIGAALMMLVVRYLPAARRRLLGADIGQHPTDQPRRMVEIPG
jgi:hypothetical protein